MGGGGGCPMEITRPVVAVVALAYIHAANITTYSTADFEAIGANGVWCTSEEG